MFGGFCACLFWLKAKYSISAQHCITSCHFAIGKSNKVKVAWLKSRPYGHLQQNKTDCKDVCCVCVCVCVSVAVCMCWRGVFTEWSSGSSDQRQCCRLRQRSSAGRHARVFPSFTGNKNLSRPSSCSRSSAAESSHWTACSGCVLRNVSPPLFIINSSHKQKREKTGDCMITSSCLACTNRSV